MEKTGQYVTIIITFIIFSDILPVIFLKISEMFLNKKILLILSVFGNAFAPKMMTSTFLDCFPFFDDRIIINLIKGEVLYYFLYIAIEIIEIMDNSNFFIYLKFLIIL